MPQIEIDSPVPIFGGNGAPQNVGWSRQANFVYEPLLAWSPRRRFSESDRYIVFNPTHSVIFEIRDDGYLGHMGVSVAYIKEKKRKTQMFQTLLPLGSYEMPQGSQSGATRYRRNNKVLDFVPMEGGARIIKVDIPRFSHNRTMRGELVLTEPDAAESLVCSRPWRNKRNAFRYSRCSPWFTAEGVIQLGTSEIVFSQGSAWGIFEWSRGIRPSADIRYWASACGLSGGRRVAFSVGHCSADSSAATENAFFVDGRLHKLDQVTFHIPPADWLSPWRFTSNDNRLEMTFAPQQERTDRSRFFFHAVKRRQVYGLFSGKAILDDGSEVEFKDIAGFAERCKMRH